MEPPHTLSEHKGGAEANARAQQNIKEGIEGRPAKWFSDVFDLVFPNLDPAVANDVWKSQLAKKEGGSSSNSSEDDD